MVQHDPITRPQTSEAALAILVEAGTLLATSLQFEETLRSVVRILVPRLCDGCAIDLKEDDKLVTAAVAHVQPEKEQLFWEMRRRYPLRLGSTHPGAIAFEGHEPVLLGETIDEVQDTIAQDEDHAKMLAEIDVQSVLALPLVAREAIIGVLTLNDGPSGRRFHSEDIPFLRDLAQRIALAVDNARLYREAQKVKGQLEAALESVTEPFFFVDREWRMVYMNTAGARVGQFEYGKRKEDLIGRILWEEYPHLVGTVFYDECQRAQAERTPRRFEFCVDRTGRWYEDSVYPSSDGLAIFARNISDRKMHEQVIRRLSVPVLEIQDGLLLLPVVGDLNVERAQLMAEQVARHIRSARAKAVVMDVTGLLSMDSAVAQYIISTAQAARLLGCHAILTGVSSEMARALVELGIRLTELSTRGALRDGIEEAQFLLRTGRLPGAQAARQA